MLPTKMQKRFVGILTLLAFFIIIVPFFVTGNNVNKDSRTLDIIAQNKSIVKDFENQKENEEQDDTQDQNLNNQELKEKNIEDSYEKPVIVEENTAKEKNKKETIINNPKQKEQIVVNKDNKNNKTTSQPQKKQENQSDKQVVKIQNNESKNITEIKVEKPKEQPNTKVDKKTDIHHYFIKVGVFSTMTNASNAKNQISAKCPNVQIKPSSSGGKRLFEVTCGYSTDKSKLDAIQSSINSSGTIKSMIIKVD